MVCRKNITSDFTKPMASSIGKIDQGQQQPSPQQIAGWAKRLHPEDERYHVSHETIYKSLFIQARGVLKKELLQCLRTQRARRYPEKSGLKGKGLGKITNAVTISERHASVEDRAVPGHWEGDLIVGPHNSCIATLEERITVKSLGVIEQRSFPQEKEAFAWLKSEGYAVNHPHLTPANI